MRRRQALRAAALTLPFAGCSGSIIDGIGTPDTRAVGETATVDGLGKVTIQSITVQRSVIDAHTWRSIYEPSNGQLIVVELADGFGGIDPAPIAPRFDGERVEPPTEVNMLTRHPRAAVAVPVRAAERATIVVTRGNQPAWALPDRAVDRLGAAPAFRVREAVLSHEEPELTLTVENRGDRDGTFRGVANYGDDVDKPIRFPVPVDGTVTKTISLSPWEYEADRQLDVVPDTRRFGLQR